MIFIKNFISHIYPDLKINLKDTDEKKVKYNDKQINNSIIVEIKNVIINENIILENINYNFKSKNVYGFKINDYYFIVQFEN